MTLKIRLRAWLKKESKMAYYISHAKLASDGLFQISVPWEEKGIRDYQVPQEAEVMQFTGLHDNNGKEIFEGDVITHRFEDYEDYTRYIIKWSDTESAFRMREIGGNHHMYVSTNIEIIGNLYENPELLK